MTDSFSTILAVFSLLVAIAAVVVAVLKLRSIQHRFEDNHLSSVWNAINGFKREYSDDCIKRTKQLTEIETDLKYLRRDVDKLFKGK